jgi:hypothetical protein
MDNFTSEERSEIKRKTTSTRKKIKSWDKNGRDAIWRLKPMASAQDTNRP